MMYSLCRQFFALCIAYPIAYLWLGITVRHQERLPSHGPAIVIANHNSHLDTLILLTRFPLSELPRVRIAAAADYFFANPVTRFIAKWFLGLVPVSRHRNKRDRLQGMADCLNDGNILVLFPEGTRGRPEALGEFKPGLWHLMKRYPGITLHPVYLHGLGRSLPKGEWIPIPFFIDVCIGEPIGFLTAKAEFMDSVRNVFCALQSQTLAYLNAEQLEGNPPEEGGAI